jgi:hypothetical protein
MTLMMEEQLQVSTSLLTRSALTCWGKPILQLLIGLMPLSHRLVGRKGNVPRLPLNTSNPKLQSIR